ncbi:MAG: DUF924 family protein [Polyangiales bacterium]
MAADTEFEPVLSYWFGDLDGDLDFPRDRKQLWWSGGDAIDRDIRERFADLVQEALSGGRSSWAETPRGRLALVILLDQFQRSLGRGSPDAFAGDPRALALCLEGIDRGHDQGLRPIERSFFYMPMVHAEDAEVASRCLDTFGRLAREIKACGVPDHPDFLSHAQMHADIVLRFGRYPHRNAILSRPPTPEEEAYLAEGGPTFGQKKS